jgi:small subunit ribosomal protein S20
LPIKKSAYKELKKARLRHFKNITTLSELKTLSKKFDKLIAEKKADEGKALVKLVASKYMKAVTKGVIHKNTASRKISRLTRNLGRLSVKA